MDRLRQGYSLEPAPGRTGEQAGDLRLAEERQADLIAMSTHGHSAKHHLLMGSVAMSIVGRSRLPLIVVRVR